MSCQLILFVNADHLLSLKNFRHEMISFCSKKKKKKKMLLWSNVRVTVLYIKLKL
jgi:hypothetical protein